MPFPRPRQEMVALIGDSRQALRGPVRRDHLAGRIGASLGYRGPQG